MAMYKSLSWKRNAAQIASQEDEFRNSCGVNWTHILIHLKIESENMQFCPQSVKCGRINKSELSDEQIDIL